MIREIDPFPRQKVFFSRYQYGLPYDLLRPDMKRALDLQSDILLVSAIANTEYLLQHLAQTVRSVQALEYSDHHYFDEPDLHTILRRFNAMPGQHKMVLTTEKDATRLELHRDFLWKNNLPLYVLPVEVAFCDNDEVEFQEEVKRFLLEFKV